MEFLKDPAKVEAASQTLLANRRSWSLPYSQKVPAQVTGLHLVAYFGVQEAVQILFRQSENVDVCDSRDQTPLWWAARNGHEAVVR